MEGSLNKWYQDEALMEGKKTTTSILPLAIDVREIESRRSKKQWKLKRTLGWAGIPCSQEIARRGEGEKNSSLYRQWQWVPQLKNPIGLKHCSTGFGRIRRRRKN